MNGKKKLLYAGLAFAAFLLIHILPAPPALVTGAGKTIPLTSAGKAAIAVLVMAVILWFTEAVPFAITGLFAIGVLTATKAAPFQQLVQDGFGNSIVLFFIGVLIFTSAISRTSLMKRFATMVLYRFGHRPKLVILAFIAIGAALSAWITDMAVAAMLLPVAAAILKDAGIKPMQGNFGRALMIAVAWGALIGGIGTPAGCGPNPLTMGYLRDLAGIRFSFLDWCIVAFPGMICMIPCAWLVLLWLFPIEKIDLRISEEETRRRAAELAAADDRIVLLEADLMKASGTGAFKDRYPTRTFDMGVAEQNMVAVAAGLAATGKVPFANSFTPFISRRACDQVAISVSYARRNVKLGGTDPGVAAELNGGAHMSFEDVGIMRSIPGMTVVEPVDAAQMKKLLPQIAAYDGPVYIRIFRRKAFTVFNDSSQITLGRAAVLREGADATIIATGIMVEQALIAVDRLQTAGISAGLVNMHTIKPLDTAAVIDAARKTGALVTAENHNIIGGLGSAVAETIAEACPVPLRRIGVRDHFGEVGKKDELLAKYGMLAGDIVAAVQSVVAMKRERGR